MEMPAPKWNSPDTHAPRPADTVDALNYFFLTEGLLNAFFQAKSEMGDAQARSLAKESGFSSATGYEAFLLDTLSKKSKSIALLGLQEEIYGKNDRRHFGYSIENPALFRQSMSGIREQTTFDDREAADRVSVMARLLEGFSEQMLFYYNHDIPDTRLEDILLEKDILLDTAKKVEREMVIQDVGEEIAGRLQKSIFAFEELLDAIRNHNLKEYSQEKRR